MSGAGSEPRTLAHVLVRLDDQAITGTLILSWAPPAGGDAPHQEPSRRSPLGADHVGIRVSAGRLIGVVLSDGSPLRRHLAAVLAASGTVSPRGLAACERRARRRGTTLEWQVSASGVATDTIRRFATIDVREWLLALMDTGGFTGRLEPGPMSADPWQEPIAIAWLTKLWRERRAERERLGAQFPGPTARFRRSGLPATELFLVRSPAQAGPPRRDQPPAPVVLPFAARLVYLWVDGRRTTTELGLATGLLDHDTRVALLELHRAGFVEHAGVAATTITPFRMLPAVLAVTLALGVGALAVARPWLPAPVKVPDQTCSVVARALGLAYRADERYPATLAPLVARGLLAERVAANAPGYAASEDGGEYTLACVALHARPPAN